MFALFFSLYYSMFIGTWHLDSMTDVYTRIQPGLTAVSIWTSSLFNNVTEPTNILSQTPDKYIALVAFVLALITSIGIVVMAVKGIKRIFSVFFYGVR